MHQLLTEDLLQYLGCQVKRQSMARSSSSSKMKASVPHKKKGSVAVSDLTVSTVEDLPLQAQDLGKLPI